MENTIENARTFSHNYAKENENWNGYELLVAYASACSAPSSIWEDGFVKYISSERDEFCKAIMGSEWNQPVRTAAETFLIAFDQLRSRLSERKIVLPKRREPNVNSDIDFSVCAGFNACLSEIKRLNGIN